MFSVQVSTCDENGPLLAARLVVFVSKNATSFAHEAAARLLLAIKNNATASIAAYKDANIVTNEAWRFVSRHYSIRFVLLAAETSRKL